MREELLHLIQIRSGGHPRLRTRTTRNSSDTKTVKILFCKNSFAGPISGADEIAVTYALELKAAGHSTGMLLVPPPASRDPSAVRLRAAGVPLITLASPAFSASLAAARKLAIRAMRACSPARPLIRTKSRNIVFDLMQRYH